MRKVVKGAVKMARDRDTTMHMSADACTAPACQSAPMSARTMLLQDTALLAVSFLLGVLVRLGIILRVAVRIICPMPANP